MAAVSFTAIRPTELSNIKLVKYGATLAVGLPVYKDPADSEHKAADANNVDTNTSVVEGLTLTPGVDGGYGVITNLGSVELVGASMTTGATYYLSSTAGQIVPEGDLASGDRVTRIGTASSATVLKLSIEYTGITK